MMENYLYDFIFVVNCQSDFPNRNDAVELNKKNSFPEKMLIVDVVFYIITINNAIQYNCRLQ